jgi:hypothetical protein
MSETIESTSKQLPVALRPRGKRFMKLRNWASIAMFVSSYAPLSVMILIQDIDYQTWKLQNPIIDYSLLGLSVVSILALVLIMRNVRQGEIITLTRVGSKSGDLVSYTIPYMITFFAFKVSDHPAFVCFLLFMILMGFLTIRTQNTFINPLLAWKYSLYEVEFKRGADEFEAVVLSKQRLFRKQQCRVRQVADFIYCVTEVSPEN